MLITYSFELGRWCKSIKSQFKVPNCVRITYCISIINIYYIVMINDMDGLRIGGHEKVKVEKTKKMDQCGELEP